MSPAACPIPATTLDRAPSLDGATKPTWLAEPLHARLTDRPIGQTVEETLLTLLPSLSPAELLRFMPGTTYYPSPGGIQEEVRSIFVQIAPLFVEEIFAIIADLRREGRTILLVEQNASAALEVADYAFVLETGRIVLEGPAAEVAHDPAVVVAYLGG